TDNYQGVDVVDPYQWLEGDDDEVKAWSDGQNRYARSILDARPDRAALEKEIRAIIAAPVVTYGVPVPAGGKLFAYRKDPDKQQRELVVMDSPEAAASATLVLDPTTRGSALTAIDWFVPSPDGSKVAVSLSEGGSESGTLHIIG